VWCHFTLCISKTTQQCNNWTNRGLKEPFCCRRKTTSDEQRLQHHYSQVFITCQLPHHRQDNISRSFFKSSHTIFMAIITSFCSNGRKRLHHSYCVMNKVDNINSEQAWAGRNMKIQKAIFSINMDWQCLIAIVHIVLADGQMLKTALFCVIFQNLYGNLHSSCLPS